MRWKEREKEMNRGREEMREGKGGLQSVIYLITKSFLDLFLNYS